MPGRRSGSDKQLKGLISAAELLLLAGIGLIGALTFWALFAPLPTAERLPVPTQQAEIADAGTAITLNPFRQTSAPGIAPVLEEGPDLAETSLDLTLHGTWIDAEGGTAIIRTPDNQQKRFREGETIWNNVVLDRVYRDQVAIRSNGVREAIRLIGHEPRRDVRQSPPTVSQTQQPITPASILNGIDFAVENSTGAPRLAISGGSPGILSQMGLQVGDKLLEVNGSPIGADPLPIMEQMRSLGSGEGVDVTIERDGMKQTVRVNIGQRKTVESDDVLRP